MTYSAVELFDPRFEWITMLNFKWKAEFIFSPYPPFNIPMDHEIQKSIRILCKVFVGYTSTHKYFIFSNNLMKRESLL